MSFAEAISNDQETVGELRTALDEYQSQIDRYENELARLNAKIEEIERLHEVQEAEIHTRDIELEDMKEEAQKLRLENANEIANLNEALELERRSVAELQQSLQEQERQLAHHIAIPRPPTEDESSVSITTVELSNVDKLLYEKEIESLRIDLADLHLKTIASEKTCEEEVRKLQQDLVDARIQNGNLLNEITELESLVWEKARSESSESVAVDEFPESQDRLGLGDLKAASTLAEEILASSPAKACSQDLEKENHELRESNIAMATYIERIVEKLLDNKALEHILEHSSPTKESKQRSRTMLGSKQGTRSPTKTLADKRGQKKIIGIGINFGAASPSTDERSRAYLSQGTLSPRSVASTSPSFAGYPPSSTSPSGGSQRRVSSGGQKSLLPLMLSEGITSPKPDGNGTMPDFPRRVFNSPPLPSQQGPAEKSTAAKGSAKRSSWLGIFTSPSVQSS
ncbi:uncharacterized protein V1513DRAFT_452241 [Lipomyces chichibuensis]|uniref:uncharacterized protein n=1 Tax=Lipomyces chichibuensis TaxID=1546026 RepID=UPI003343A96A